MKKYLTAFLLILFAPIVGLMFIRQRWHKKTMFLCSGFLLLVIATWRYCNHNNELLITDLTAAYDKGTTRNTTDYVVIHHTAGAKVVRPSEIAKIHLTDNRWSSIGYHYLVYPDGSVIQLRSDNEAEVPHAEGYNNNSVAICLIGNFSTSECPGAQWDAALRLTRRMLIKYHLTANAVKGHRELSGNHTECPGLNFNLNKFREEL